MPRLPLAAETAVAWHDDPAHRALLLADARRQLGFFDSSLRADGGFDVLDHGGRPLPRTGQELHTTTRLIHSYALAKSIGHPRADVMIDAGMTFLKTRHRDTAHGGFLWSVDESSVQRDIKLAYGHVFVLLAAASAKQAGHPDADRLLADISEVLETRYWDEAVGLYRDEFTRDWQPFSTYRGMNANMHGTEAMLTAFEATGESLWLDRAGRILSFFTETMAPEWHWRIPEHYTGAWQVDRDYAGDPMFRPAGTTPGHSFEMARLCLQHWDLSGRPESDAPDRARRLVEHALADAWQENGGLCYTLSLDGSVDIADRYWWPVTEAIGVVSTLLKCDAKPEDEAWYRRLWRFADEHLIDHTHGGWFPELDANGQPVARQFHGKPDIYHSVQAALFPLTPGISRFQTALADIR